MNYIFRVGDRVEITKQYKSEFNKHYVGKIINLSNSNGTVLSSSNYESAVVAKVRWNRIGDVENWMLYGLNKLSPTDLNIICKKVK